jgi:hypothetical protein
MNWRTIGKITAVAMFVGISGFDVVLAAFGGESATFSDIIGDNAASQSWIPWVFGVIGGHWFWRLKGDKVPGKFWRLGGLVTVTGALVGLQAGGIIPDLPPLVVMLVGVVGGRLGWPQEVE